MLYEVITLKSPMTGILYVLDEPSFGLSAQDSVKIAGIIKDLKNNGNTILLNDHSREILKITDSVITSYSIHYTKLYEKLSTSPVHDDCGVAEQSLRFEYGATLIRAIPLSTITSRAASNVVPLQSEPLLAEGIERNRSLGLNTLD